MPGTRPALCASCGEGEEVKISELKTKLRQPMLFDEPLGNHGHVRTLIGEWAEQITAYVFEGNRHRTDSTADYCPDVSTSEGYIECKAAGRSRQTFIYGGRLDKDTAFANGHPLSYCIWTHSADSKQAATVSQLRRMFFGSLTGYVLIPFWNLHRIALAQPITRLNSKYGNSNSNPTYGSGYRIPLRLLDRWRVDL